MTHSLTCHRFWFGEPQGNDAKTLCGCLSITFAGQEISCIRIEVVPEDTIGDA